MSILTAIVYILPATDLFPLIFVVRKKKATHPIIPIWTVVVRVKYKTKQSGREKLIQFSIFHPSLACLSSVPFILIVTCKVNSIQSQNGRRRRQEKEAS